MILLCVAFVAACTATPQEPEVRDTFPYGMSEREWNDLSAMDRARLRRDFYFYKSGSSHFVNPDIELQGREQNAFAPRK